MHILRSIRSVTTGPRGLFAELEDGWRLRLIALAPWLVRSVLEPAEGLPDSRSWMVAPQGDTPAEGRDRDDLTGFPEVNVRVSVAGGGAVLDTGLLRVTLAADPVRLATEIHDGTAWRPLMEDRASGAYVLVEGGRKLRHYLHRRDSDQYFGLGDKTGPMNRHGRRFRLLQLDALGYDAEHGDPLYKHIPFVITRHGESGMAAGLFYDCLSPMTFDMGCERSNYFGLYSHVEAEERGLDCHIIAGPGIAEVTRRFAELTGKPHFPPRWTLGFAFTSMHHADHPQAQATIQAFAERCRAEAIPISAIHFGSGYSSRGKRRYVFTWNRDKVPDAPALFARLKELGYHTVANLKPVLIDDHPAYAERAATGGFINDEAGEPVLEQFWDGYGSFLDFTNADTMRWWQSQLSSQVLDVGFDAAWNDNNEYEVFREGAVVSGHGRPLAAVASRPLQALLMTRASYEETLRREPAKRPFTVTRAGPPGIQRYAETWSGDNATSWHTLAWNVRNANSMALSGLSRTGHDIGGFAGPRPDPELLLRWVESMALMPRCLMNSWKPHVGVATEPWTHPEVLERIRAVLMLRYRFLPLLYTLAHRASLTGEPMIRPVFHDFEADAASFGDDAVFLLGPQVLVAPVVQPGATTRSLYLPATPEGWVAYHDGSVHAGGGIATVDAPPGTLPIFVRGHSALALAGDIDPARPHEAPARELAVFLGPADAGTTGHHFEDDGESWGYRDGACLQMTLAVRSDANEAAVHLARSGGHWPLPDAWRVSVTGRQMPVRIAR
jgi:alpha-glucosidase